jgi:hypothetical protein
VDLLPKPLENLAQNKFGTRIDVYESLRYSNPLSQKPTQRLRARLRVIVAAGQFGLGCGHGLFQRWQRVLAKEHLDPFERCASLLQFRGHILLPHEQTLFPSGYPPDSAMITATSTPAAKQTK